MSECPQPDKPWSELTAPERAEWKQKRATWRRLHPSERHRLIADVCKTIRRNAQWSQAELASKLSVSTQSVSRWERGAGYLPRLKTADKLAQLHKQYSGEQHATAGL